MSLAQVLQLLPSLGTDSNLIEKFGEPDFRRSFAHDDPSNEYYPSRKSIESWKQLAVSTPPLLFDTMPIGTKMVIYIFEYGPLGLNPTTGVLTVCVDDHNRIIGWFYSTDLVGIENKAGFSYQPRHL